MKSKITIRAPDCVLKDLRQEAKAFKEVLAEQARNCGCSKKHDRGWGRRAMRYLASQKLEFIRLVQQSIFSAGRTLEKARHPALDILPLV